MKVDEPKVLGDWLIFNITQINRTGTLMLESVLSFPVKSVK